MPRAARAGHVERFFGVVRKKIMGIRFTAFCRRWRIWHLPLRVLTVTSASSHGCWGKCAPLITASILPPSCPRLPMQSPPWFKELFWLRLHIPREPHSNSTTRCPRPPIHQSKDTSPSMFLADNNAHTSLWTMQRTPRYSCPPIPELFTTVHLGPAGLFLYHHCLQDASVDVKKWDKLEAKWSLMWHIMRIWCWTQESWLQRKHWLAHRSHQWVTWTFYPAPPIPSCHPHSPTAVLGDSRATQTFTRQGSQNERRWEPTGKPGGLLSLQTGLFFLSWISWLCPLILPGNTTN